MRRQKETPHEAISIAGAHQFEVAYNHIHDCSKEGIDIKETSSNGIVHHNHIHHVKRQGLYVDAWFGTVEQIEIYGNRIHHCGDAGIVISVENGTQVRNVNIHDNIIHHNSGSGLFFSRWGDGPTLQEKDIVIADNVIHQSEKVHYPIRAGWPPDDYANVYAIRGTHSIRTNPHFKAPEAGNFQMPKTSGAAGKGADLKASAKERRWE
ncbi:MAG: hypothetical protein B6240_04600 [Desulfobacteraceae bacterium 4572_87]|nr:MAG: hypothetical protein B6240_04600 [Desulfobacteraceae bacterium 4572_87]